jgi:hypothetical protein
MNPLAPFSDVSLDAYVRARQVELAKSLRRRRAIYLDIKFWIILRDVVMGLGTAPAEQELLSLLREGVAEDSIFCPISDTTFAELLKKADVESRRLAAALIDELSIGVTLIPTTCEQAPKSRIFSTLLELRTMCILSRIWCGRS